MVKALLFDFARVLLFTKDKDYQGTLNELNHKLSGEPDYDFLSTFEMNKELMGHLESIKGKVGIYMFTSETIQQRPEIAWEVEKLFVKVFSAKEMGMPKTEPSAYKFILNDLKLAPEEVVFIDDNPENILGAKQAGITGIQYKNNPQILTELQKLGF